MKRLSACVAVVVCLCLLLAPTTVVARAETPEPKPPTITLAAANRYVKEWATKYYVKPRVVEVVINKQKAVATFTLEKIEPCKKVRGGSFGCALKVNDHMQQENGYDQETTIHEPMGVVVAKAKMREEFEGGNFPVGVYPLRNPYRVFVYDY